MNINLTIIQGYTSSFEAYTITDPTLQSRINEWTTKAGNLANNITDAMEFQQQFASSGLQDEYMTLITAAATSIQHTNSGNNSQPSLPTVKEFVDQYRAAYNEVCKQPYRSRAIRAYETLFAVADRTSDLLEAQIIIERERLLWNIVKEDAIDIFSAVVEAADPLFEFVTRPLELQLEAYQQASCDEQLDYLIELTSRATITPAERARQLITISACTSLALMDYCRCKKDIYQWSGKVENHVAGMVFLRKRLHMIFDLLKSQFNMTIFDLLDDEQHKIWLLAPHMADGIGRHKISLHPQNLLVFRDILTHEIIPNLPPYDALMRTQSHVFYISIGDEYYEKVRPIIDQLNSAFIYFQNMEDLKPQTQSISEQIDKLPKSK